MNIRPISSPRSVSDKLADIKSCLDLASDLEFVSNSPRLDVELILAHLLQKDRSWLYAWPEFEISSEIQEKFLQKIEWRKRGCPLAYILGRQEFWSLNFEVNEHVLIPRPETELLIELVLDLVKENSFFDHNLLELGSGSGAISISLASELNRWKILAVEKSLEALEVTNKNISLHAVKNVTSLQSDWYASVTGKYSIIVANPPYIAPGDGELEKFVKQYEPHSALLSENDGLEDLEKIISQAPSYLCPNGYLCLEHGYRQAQSVRKIFKRNGFIDVKTLRDFSEKDRVTFASCGNPG